MRLSKLAQITAMMMTVHATASAYAAGSETPAATATDSGPAHFHPQGKPPSKYTIALHDQNKNSLPFEDARDFEESQKGFIAKP
ncbi:MAG: hypothetical protein ACRC7H_10175, partial [Plesiomonas shigelloides]